MALKMPFHSCATRSPVFPKSEIASNAPSIREFRRLSRYTSSFVNSPMIIVMSCRNFMDSTRLVVDGNWQQQSACNASASDAAFSGRQENSSDPLRPADAELVDASVVDGPDNNEASQVRLSNQMLLQEQDWERKLKGARSTFS